VAIVIVVLPMATTPAPTDIGVPATVIGASPGLMVVPSTASSPDKSGTVIVMPFTVAIGDVVAAAPLKGKGENVSPWKTIPLDCCGACVGAGATLLPT